MYNKLIAAVIGLLVLLANQFWGVDLTGLEQPLVDAISIIIAAVTGTAVYAVPNKPSAQ